MEFSISPGDSVQARKSSASGIAIVEFVATTVTAGAVDGSPLGELLEADGWTFELIRKGDPSLPTTISDLAAWTVQDRTAPTRIVGPTSGGWQTIDGQPVNPLDVLGWQHWADYEESIS